MFDRGISDYIKDMHADLARRDAEIKRLRAVLESLIMDPIATLDEPDRDAEVIFKMRAMAAAALNIQHREGET
jgi:hypothetical protein